MEAAWEYCREPAAEDTAHSGAIVDFQRWPYPPGAFGTRYTDRRMCTDGSHDVEQRQRRLLVMLPGLDGTGKLFDTFIQVLGAEIDTCVIGYPTDQPLGYEELESLVRAALPADRAFVLLGESFAGPLAIRIAADPPPGLAGIILCGTFAKNPYPWLGWASALSFLVPLKSLPRWVRAPLMWGSQDAVRVPRRAERAIAGVAGSVVRRRIAALLTVDASEALRKVCLPALILYAQHDRVINFRATQWLSDHLPSATLVAIDGPHLLLQATPRPCADAILRWLPG